MNEDHDMEDLFADGDRIRARVRQLVLSSDCDSLAELFDPNCVHAAVTDQAWDLIPALCEGLTVRNESERTDLVDTCYRAVNLLAKTGNAKEVVLALLEQADTFLPDFKWQGLLEPIQTALLRLPSKRQYSLKTTLETLFAHIELIDIPEHSDVDEEKRLLAIDTEVNRLLDNVRLYVDFLQPFVEELPIHEMLTSDQAQQRDYLLIAIFRILSKKFLYLYYDPIDDVKPTTWYISEKLMRYVAHLCRDFYKASGQILELMYNAENDQNNDTDEDNEVKQESDVSETCKSVPHVSVAMFHYLVYAEGLSQDRVPSVLTPSHVFEHCLPSIALMFSSPRPVIVDKGAQLALTLLHYHPVDTFSRQFTEHKEFTAFMDNLLQAVVMCQSREVRSRCVKIFPTLLHKFDARGKHVIFMYCFRHTGHSGVKGHILHLVKEELARSFDNDNDYMSAARIHQIVQLLFVLPEGALSDLLDLSDVIIACLNFVRYLVIRDKDNLSGIWNHVTRLETDYFEPLRQALTYSRGHYELELQNCREGKSATEDLLRTGIDYKVKVGEQELPVDIPSKQAMAILQGAIHNFDLIHSLLGRVQELIKINKPKQDN